MVYLGIVVDDLILVIELFLQLVMGFVGKSYGWNN